MTRARLLLGPILAMLAACDLAWPIHLRQGVPSVDAGLADAHPTDAGPADASPAPVVFVRSATTSAPSSPLVATQLTLPIGATAQGDLLLVSVGWGAGGAGLSPTVFDSNGNAYTTVFGGGPVLWAQSDGVYAEQLLYAPNVAAGTSYVTVDLQTAPTLFFELRVLEYAGALAVAPLDVSASNNGNGTWPALTLNAGPLSTSDGDELVFALGHWAGPDNFDGPCPAVVSTTGFTARSLDGGGGVLAADEISAAPSEVSVVMFRDCPDASASAAPWAMLMAAFKSAR
jgi:hypothetical protein